MSQELQTAVPVPYAAFKLRFRALQLDAWIFTAIFLVGGLTTGIIFENSVPGRVGMFSLILILLIGYEPLMVSRYGGTFGHQKANIRIACASSGANLPIWRALV